VQRRREACKIPAGEHHRPKWQMAIGMLDELAECGYRPPVVAADAGYGDTTAFRLALHDRNISYVVAVKGSTSAYTADAELIIAAYTGRGRLPVPAYPDPPSSCKDIIGVAGRAAGKELTWRKGTKTSPSNKTAAMRSRFLAVRVNPANRDIARADDGSLPQHWLIAKWCELARYLIIARYLAVLATYLAVVA
jgi:SRSO17 transposase